MKLISATLCVLLLCAPAQAAEYVVTIPDSLIEDGLKWHHFYGRRNKSNFSQEGTSEERAKFFLDECVFDPATRWVLDSVLFVKTWGRIKTFNESGIKVEVKR